MKAILQHAAARIDRISCMDSPRTRHGSNTVPRFMVAAVARDGRFSAAAEVTESRSPKEVSAEVVAD